MSDKSNRIQIRLDDEDFHLVTALARREKLTRTEVFRRAVRHMAKSHGLPNHSRPPNAHDARA